MESVRIRASTPNDVPAVHQLIQDTIDACYVGVYPPRAVAFFKEHNCAKNIQKRQLEGHILVAERDSQIVATGTLIDDIIVGVYVYPKVQRTGCGQLIMKELEAIAYSRGLQSVGLDVSLTSRDFYMKLGYRITEECTIDVGCGEKLHYWKARKAFPKDRQESTL
jgi:GNAT superfamily N-acetyltransferase